MRVVSFSRRASQNFRPPKHAGKNSRIFAHRILSLQNSAKYKKVSKKYE